MAECSRCGEPWGDRCEAIFAQAMQEMIDRRKMLGQSPFIPSPQRVAAERAACRAAALENQFDVARPSLPDNPPDAESHGSSDWEELRHWEYCVGGDFEESRRKTTSGVADKAIRGFRIAAITANLIPGVGGIISGAIAGVSWTLQALGVFRTRTMSYKVVRELFAKIFSKDVNLPLANITRYDWAIAIPEIPVGMIENLIHDFRLHTFERLGIPTKIRTDLGDRVVPAEYPDDTDTRHFVQCVDWLQVYKVAELPYKIEWVFAFNPADMHAWEKIEAALTDHQRLYAEELKRLNEENRQKGGGGDHPPDKPKNGNGEENGKGSNLLLPLAIFIAALIYFRGRK